MARSTIALVARKSNCPLAFETAYINEIRPDEAAVEIHAVGICLADISCLDGTLPVKFPNVFGHEDKLQFLLYSDPTKHRLQVRES